MNELNVFDKSLNSFIQFTAFGGSSIVVSPDNLTKDPQVSGWMKEYNPRNRNNMGMMLNLAPPATQYDDDHARTRIIEYGESNEDEFVYLVGWGRDVTHGQAVQENTFSQDSMSYEEFMAMFPESQDEFDSPTSVIDVWKRERVIEAGEDSQGWLYDISILWRVDNQYFVGVNGETFDDAWPTMGEAQEEAMRLDAEYKEGVLPEYLRREFVEEDEPEGMQKGDFTWDNLKWDWVGKPMLIMAGIAIVGLVIFFTVRSVGTEAGKKAVGSA